jgi:tetratricopeptide (TPR) repeat protein
MGGVRGGALGVLLPLLLGGVVVAAYWPALWGGFLWDDDLYVYENRLLHEPDGLWRIWLTTDFESQFFPLTITVLRFAYQLWGLETFGYHALNVAVHLLNTFLVWRLLGRLGVAGAGVAAAVFALHPVQVESVAWITELKNLLSTTFYLLAIGAYLRFEETSAWRWYLAVLVVFVLGLASKTVVCTLPGALVVLRWWRGKPFGLRELALVPLLVIGVSAGLFVAWMETSHIGTIGPLFDFSLAQRVLIAGHALWFYLGKLVLPLGLAFSYPRWDLDPADPWQWMWVLGVLIAAGALWLGRERLGRGPAAGFAFFAVLLSPMLGFVNYYTMRYSFVADHYQYLACIGPITVVTAAASALLGRAGGGARERRRQTDRAVAGGVAVVAVAALASLTWRQAHAYVDAEALWRDTISKNPGSWMAHNNLGNILVDQGQVDQGLALFERARELNPDYADPYSNIGGVLVRRGRAEEALPYFERAIGLEPDTADFRYNLAVALTQLERVDEAIATFENVLARVPRHAPAHNNLALLLVERGALDDAIAHYRIAVEESPNEAGFHENLADALVLAGDHEGAAAEYRAALRLRPEDPALHEGLAGALGMLGRRDDAIAEYTRALALAPDMPAARYNLAVHLAAAGRLDEAATQYREALRLDPDDAATANNLGAVLLSLGDTDGAIEHFGQALRLDPDDTQVRNNLALTLHRVGRADRGIALLEEGIGRAPAAATLLNSLAWIRATTPAAAWRDGAEAVRLAERACALTDGAKADYLDTLAAAYAEAGRFPDAVRTIKQALDQVAEPAEKVQELESRRVLYESGQPYREPQDSVP